MKKLLVLLFFALTLCFCAAFAENTDILGQPFPDFTAADTEGGSFTLTEALKDHDAVLINIWATWCPPCEREFPYLNAAFEKYGDRVAFIALSCETQDTLEKIGEYRTSHGIAFSMGRDEGQRLAAYTGAYSIPTTVIVDRFGNAAFMHSGMFSTAAEVERLLNAFLGDGYTETTVLTEIPRDTATRLFPVSSERAVYVDNENAQRIDIQLNGEDSGLMVYVVNDDAAALRLEIAGSDTPTDMIYFDAGVGKIMDIPSLLDHDRNAYVYSQPLPAAQDDYHYSAGSLVDNQNVSDPDELDVYLISNEDYIDEFIDLLSQEGYEVSWAFAEEEPNDQPPLTEYILHIADQNGDAVPGAFINFCTDTECTTAQSDADGVIRFSGAPDIYHLVVLKVPAGYSYDKEFEIYTQPVYGEWYLRIKKD